MSMEVFASYRDYFSNTSLLHHEAAAAAGSNLSSSEQLMLGTGGFYQQLLTEFWDHLYTHRQPSSVLLICLYVPVFLIALFGNILVLMVVLLHKHMRNVTNGFIVNLAIADILVTLVCVPTAVGQAVYKVWVYGEFVCKITAYMQGVSVASSVFTIMLLSIDRYLAIRHPMTFRTFSTVRHAARLTLTVWVLSLCIMIPLLLVRRVDVIELMPGQQLHFCSEVWENSQHRQVYDIFLFTCVFVLPGCFVTLSYSRIGCRLWTEDRQLYRSDSCVAKEAVERVMTGRRKVARMLVVLAVLFASCWMPYHLLTLYLGFSPLNPDGTVGLAALPFTLWLGHANSALNPVLYCFLSSSFRRAAWRMLGQPMVWRDRHSSKKMPHPTPVDLVVEITPLKGTNKTADYTKRPLIRVFAGGTGTSSTTSTKISRSSNTSFRSSCRSSCRSSTSAGSVKLKIRDSWKKKSVKDAKDEAGKPEVISVSSEVLIPGEPYEKPLDDIIQPVLLSSSIRGRREIFDQSLNIPTTINEETSHGSQTPNPCPENMVVRLFAAAELSQTLDTSQQHNEVHTDQHYSALGMAADATY